MRIYRIRLPVSSLYPILSTVSLPRDRVISPGEGQRLKTTQPADVCLEPADPLPRQAERRVFGMSI